MQVSAQELKEKYGSHCVVNIYGTLSTIPEPAMYTSIHQVDVFEQLGSQPDNKTNYVRPSASGPDILHYPNMEAAQNDLLSSSGPKGSGLEISRDVLQPSPLPETLNAPIAIEEGQTVFSVVIKPSEEEVFEISEFEITDVTPKFLPHFGYFTKEGQEKGFDVGFWYTAGDTTFLSFEENVNPYDPKNSIYLDRHFNGQNNALLFLSNEARSKWIESATNLISATQAFQEISSLESMHAITRLMTNRTFQL